MELFSPYLQLVRPIFYRNPIYESTGASWILQGFAEWPISADRKSQLITCTDLFADESVSKIPCLISNVMDNVSEYVRMMCRMWKSGSIIYLNKYLKHMYIHTYMLLCGTTLLKFGTDKTHLVFTFIQAAQGRQ